MQSGKRAFLQSQSTSLVKLGVEVRFFFLRDSLLVPSFHIENYMSNISGWLRDSISPWQMMPWLVMILLFVSQTIGM